MIVHPDYRRKGTGNEIMRKLVEEYQKANIHIELFSEHNNASYYENIGFKEFAIGMKYNK
ncbi:GNAT family N-acetyltransferase [Lederbergia citri]|uniref:GNAT family N-acetyltransferase n=1 Tax=Lederbergia citri TaxID=2833580 RepID=UPI002D807F27|nr:GNAT family N-acetyltransferase [Lederbergia citri]